MDISEKTLEKTLEKINKNRIVILSKKDCIYCEKLINFLNLRGEEFLVIKCDEYLIHPVTKELFLNDMKEIIGEEYRKFPMCFIDGKFTGGYSNSITYF